jgi:glycosyl hydrolase family 114
MARRDRAQYRVAAALATALVGCGGSGPGNTTDGGTDGPPVPAWWQPKVGEVKNWDIQISSTAGAVDVSAPRLMYDLDLWAVVPAPTTISYDDGTSVTVPPGALAGMIAQLHARTPSTIVICHVDTGLLDLTLPDAKKFPGYKADPKMIPDNPSAPAPGTVTGAPEDGSAIGWSLGVASQRLLDVRQASRGAWSTYMFKRFDLAKQIGCDGVEPSHNDVAVYISGFLAGAADSFSWYTEVATQGHMRKLSTGMKNGDTVPSQPDMEAANFDWMMVERCGEFDTCDATRPFINLGKPVFAIDYNVTSPDDNGQTMPQGSTLVCMHQGLAMIADGLYKDVALSKAVRTQCEP